MSKLSTKLPVACFAPSLTDAKLAEYAALIDALPTERSEVKDAMTVCLRAVQQWWELPESARKDGDRFEIRHKGKTLSLAVTPLEDAHAKALWDAVPWMRELLAMEALFDGISNTGEKPLRDAAFHLLWHCKELTLDREPMTVEKLA